MASSTGTGINALKGKHSQIPISEPVARTGTGKQLLELSRNPVSTLAEEPSKITGAGPSPRPTRNSRHPGCRHNAGLCSSLEPPGSLLPCADHPPHVYNIPSASQRPGSLHRVTQSCTPNPAKPVSLQWASLHSFLSLFLRYQIMRQIPLPLPPFPPSRRSHALVQKPWNTIGSLAAPTCKDAVGPGLLAQPGAELWGLD